MDKNLDRVLKVVYMGCLISATAFFSTIAYGGIKTILKEREEKKKSKAA